MARAVQNYTVTDEGRDRGKVFVITEMSSSKAESWAMRVILALMASGTQLPEGYEKRGMAGLAEMGFKMLSSLRWETLEPLLAEMLACVQYMPDPSKPHVTRELFEQDIEEVATRIKLRLAVWSLHTDFLQAVAPSLFAQFQAPAVKKAGRNTKTSPR